MPEPMDAVLEQFAHADALLKSIPGAEDILQSATSPEDAMQRLTELLANHPAQMLSVVAAVESFDASIQRVMNEGPPPVVVGPSGEVRWNPLVEAGILERSVIDGDVPEFRTGPLPEGATPAIPIKTTSLDPVYVGLQLKRTSEMATSAFALAVEEHKALCDRIQEEGQRSGLLPAVIEKNLPPVPTGIEGYEAGRSPALWEPEPVNALDIYALTKDEAAELSWLAFATTQGRRSFAPSIAKSVADYPPDGIFVRLAERSDLPPDPPFHVWSAQSFGPRDLAPHFSPPATAVSVFVQVLAKSGMTGTVNIYVEPLSATADRRFGWVLYYWEATP